VANSAISPYPTSAQPSPGLIPGWLTWYSPGARQWHSRKQDSSGRLIHDNDVEGLREQAASYR
jgi:hypothetical protein